MRAAGSLAPFVSESIVTGNGRRVMECDGNVAVAGAVVNFMIHLRSFPLDVLPASPLALHVKIGRRAA